MDCYYDDVSSTTLDLIQEVIDQLKKEIKQQHQEKMERLEREIGELKDVRDNWDRVKQEHWKQYSERIEKARNENADELAKLRDWVKKLHSGELPRMCDWKGEAK